MAYNARMPAPVRELAESPQSSAAVPSLYARDLYFWSREQAAALRRRDSGAIDWDNVTEEIESLGSEQEHRWTSLAARTVEHLLKIQHWHGAQASTLFKWRHEVRTWRSGMARVIRKNPSLQGAYGELQELAWHDGRHDAIEGLVEVGTAIEGESRAKYLRREWQLRIPEQCPWSLEEIVGYDPRTPKDRTARRQRRRFGPQPDPDMFPPPVARRLAGALRDRPGAARARRSRRRERGRSRRKPTLNR